MSSASDMSFGGARVDMQKAYYEQQAHYPGFYTPQNGYYEQIGGYPQAPVDNYRAQCVMQGQMTHPQLGPMPGEYGGYAGQCMQAGMPPPCGLPAQQGLAETPVEGAMKGQPSQEIYPWMRESRQNNKQRPTPEPAPPAQGEKTKLRLNF